MRAERGGRGSVGVTGQGRRGVSRRLCLLMPTAPAPRLHVARSDRAQASAPYAARPAGPEILALGAWINGSDSELVIGETESSVSPDLGRAVACDVDPRPRDFFPILIEKEAEPSGWDLPDLGRAVWCEANMRAIGVNNCCLFFRTIRYLSKKKSYSNKKNVPSLKLNKVQTKSLFDNRVRRVWPCDPRADRVHHNAI
jgi:hypothetical protein